MRVLDKAPSAPKLWVYHIFGGGKGKGEEEAKLELEQQKLFLDTLKALQPKPKKRPEQVRQTLADLALTCQQAADRALGLGNVDIARQLTKQVDRILSSPLIRPPPDDRSDEQLNDQERKAREKAWEETISRRTILLAKQETQLIRALELALGGSDAKVDLEAQLAKMKGDQLMLGVQPCDPFRAALSETAVRTTLTALETKLRNVVPAEHQEALFAKLGTKLTGIIDEMVREAVLKYMQNAGVCATKGSPGGSYAAAMSDLLRASDGQHDKGSPLFRMFPGLQEMIDLEANQFTRNIGELLDQVAADRGELESEMFGGAQVKGLKDLTITNSDPHHGGRRVTILTFEGTDGQDRKVVNKPRDIRVDAKFVGTTGEGGMDASMSERATELMRAQEAKRLQVEKNRRALLEVLKTALAADYPDGLPDDDVLLKRIDDTTAEGLAGLPSKSAPMLAKVIAAMKREIAAPSQIDEDVRAEAERIVPALPTYKFLDRQQGGSDPHRYGWVEFIEHGRPQDNVLDEAGAKTFYQQSGQLAALALIFGIEDIHQGNIMVRNGQPVLTDLEIAFSSKMFRELDDSSDPREVRSYLAGKMGNTMIDSGLGKHKELSFTGATVVTNDRIQQRTGMPYKDEASENHVFLQNSDGSLTHHSEGLPAKFSADLMHGFAQVCDAFGDPSALEDNKEFVDSFSGAHVRYHLLPTATQLQARQMEMLDGYKKNRDARARDNEGLVRRDPDLGLDKAPWKEALIEATASDLAGRDVAYYTQELGSREVLHNGEDAMSYDGGTDLLSTDGLDVAKQNLELLATPQFREIAKTVAGEMFTRIQPNRTGVVTEVTAETRAQLKGGAKTFAETSAELAMGSSEGSSSPSSGNGTRQAEPETLATDVWSEERHEDDRYRQYNLSAIMRDANRMQREGLSSQDIHRLLHDNEGIPDDVLEQLGLPPYDDSAIRRDAERLEGEGHSPQDIHRLLHDDKGVAHDVLERLGYPAY